MVFVATNEEISLAFCAAETLFEGNSLDLDDDEGEQSDIGAEAITSNERIQLWKKLLKAFRRNRHKYVQTSLSKIPKGLQIIVELQTKRMKLSWEVDKKRKDREHKFQKD